MHAPWAPIVDNRRQWGLYGSAKRWEDSAGWERPPNREHEDTALKGPAATIDATRGPVA